MGPGLTTSFSVFRCSVHSTQTFWALSACDETLFLSAVLNKDCVYNGVAWHLGVRPSGSWVATIKKIISDITLMLLLWRYWNFVPHDNLQCPPHSGHGSGLNINSTFHYRQFVVRDEVLQWLFGWWPAVRRWRREEISEDGGMKGQLLRVVERKGKRRGKCKYYRGKGWIGRGEIDGMEFVLLHLIVCSSSFPWKKQEEREKE